MRAMRTKDATVGAMNKEEHGSQKRSEEYTVSRRAHSEQKWLSSIPTSAKRRLWVENSIPRGRILTKGRGRQDEEGVQPPNPSAIGTLAICPAHQGC